LYAAYEKLEQCCKQGNENVFEFKIHLEDEPTELPKTAKFVRGLLPSLNRKLCGQEYSSLAHAVEAVQIEEQCLGESERCTHIEDQEQHGKQRELPRTKELPRKDLRKADQKVLGKLKVKSSNKPARGAGTVVRKATSRRDAPNRWPSHQSSCFRLMRTVAPG